VQEFGRCLPVVAVQNELSLACPDRQKELAVVDRAGAMFMAYAPLGRGLLTGRFGQTSLAGDLRSNMPQFQCDAEQASHDRLKAIDKIAKHRTTSRAALALAWALQAAPNVVPIPGARSPDQIKTAMSATGLILTEDDLKGLRQAKIT
jgi:aryl-alcohol dehydrogenase-like predicted oxidoreductase